MDNITERNIMFWLAMSGASAKKIHALLTVYKPLEIWESIAHVHFEKALGTAVYNSLNSTKKIKTIEEKLFALEKRDISVVTIADEEYPERLIQAEVNPPVVLYCMGDIGLLKSNCIAVVGTRACTRYGKETTEKLTRELAIGGLTVVSGLATGIDAYAHAETLNSGGKTIAVLGGGFDHIYPSVNIPLFGRILEKGGLVVCEYPPETSPQSYTFPERNRIISGLSAGVVIVEAGKGSGTLITAECALEQGRDVFAVPGNISSPKSEGTNELILGGAKITLCAKQIFEELQLTVPEIKKKLAIELDFFEQTVYNLLENESMPFDELLLQVGKTPAELSELLLSLELKGAIKRLPANYFSRAD